MISNKKCQKATIRVTKTGPEAKRKHVKETDDGIKLLIGRTLD